MNTSKLPEIILSYYDKLASQVEIVLPKLIVFVSVLIVGWITAKLMGLIVRKMTQGLQSITDRLFYSKSVSSHSRRLNISHVLSTITVWLTLLVFFLFALYTLNSLLIDKLLTKMFLHLGNIALCTTIIVIGYFVANYIRAYCHNQQTWINRVISPDTVYNLVIFVFVMLGLEQLKLNLELIHHIILVALSLGFLAVVVIMAIAFKSILPDMLAMRSVKHFLSVGQHVTIGEHTGLVVSIDNSSITLENQGETIIITGSTLLSQPISQLKQVDS